MESIPVQDLVWIAALFFAFCMGFSAGFKP